jgi:phosphoenolpyruvate carboxykinase (ATP)
MPRARTSQTFTDTGLEEHGLYNLSEIYWNLPRPLLYEHAISRREGVLSVQGPLVVRTGHHTGRSPNDRFIVEEPSTATEIHWSKANRPFDAERFEELHRRLGSYLQTKEVFVQDCYAGADPEYRLPVRIITEYAWHSLFARNMFLEATPEDLEDFEPEFTVIDTPRFHAIPSVDGTESETFIIINFAKKLVIIGGSSYGGEIKKSIFSVMNYLLPFRGVLPMHCSANLGAEDDCALFFGLSATGKTTLSADPRRRLIGDDEHGWSDRGVFNFEGGCYAKMINLSAEEEPQIYAAARRFGTVLENVAIDAHSRLVDFTDETLTENTRGAYPIWRIPNSVPEGRGGHPRNVMFLTADAFGVLPPISKLTREQAMYQFLSGYTAKIAGTERGITEPVPFFSACYGAPFLPLHPGRYAAMLGEKIERHDADVWLVNTGWTGGPYGEGHRMRLPYTRAMVNAALEGKLAEVPTREHPVFGLHVPAECPDVPSEILDPRSTWRDREAYDRQAKRVAGMFVENFGRYEGEISEEIRAAGPRV